MKNEELQRKAKRLLKNLGHDVSAMITDDYAAEFEYLTDIHIGDQEAIDDLFEDGAFAGSSLNKVFKSVD